MRGIISSIGNEKKSVRILFHILFWLCYIAFYTVHFGAMYENPEYFKLAASMFFTVWVVAGTSYLLVYFLMPKFLFKKRYSLFFVLLVISVITTVLLHRAVSYYIALPLLFPHLIKNLEYWDFHPLGVFLAVYSVVGLFGLIKLLKYWFKSEQEKLELEKQNKSSELSMLRNQINPHFLFNTLNNIDTLIMKDNRKASESVIMLSDIMRYMLYKTDDKKTPLYEEIEYLKSYISLQQLRLVNPESVNIEIIGSCSGKYISPMLLIPFVENAFKHGIKNDENFKIEILIECLDESVKIEVNNFYNTKEQINKDKTTGIGLANIKRRLELLYPDMHELNISDTDGSFHVDSTIYFNNHGN